MTASDPQSPDGTALCGARCRHVTEAIDGTPIPCNVPCDLMAGHGGDWHEGDLHGVRHPFPTDPSAVY